MVTGKIYKPHEFANLVGVSVKTLQRWDNAGRLKAGRTPTNMRFYTHKQYLEVIGELVDDANREGVDSED